MVVAVHEAYRSYKAPKWIRTTVERLLASVPPGHLSGLGAIVLTVGAGVGRGKTRRVAGRKYDRRACRGFYHRKHKGTPASIDIIVDNVIAGVPPFLFAFSLFRDLVIGGVLFHELGHHLDATIGAGAPTGEAAAEDWSRRLGRLHFRRRYRWLRPFVGILRPLVRWMRRRTMGKKAKKPRQPTSGTGVARVS